MPDLYVIAGPNGVGKTTYAKKYLPDFAKCYEFLNADLIAQGLAPFKPESVSIRAGRIMLERMKELCSQRTSFALETTLTGRAFASQFREAKSLGYRIHLDFLWVKALETTSQRVEQRIRKGGHSIPEETQRRRFGLGLRNLFVLYRPLLDYWQIFDNTESGPRKIAEETKGVLTIHSQKDFDIIHNLADMLPMDTESTEGTKIEETCGEYYNVFTDSKVALRALNLAFADVVLENHRYGLPVIQEKDGKTVATPTADLLDLARRIIETNGEPTPEQLGDKT